MTPEYEAVVRAAADDDEMAERMMSYERYMDALLRKGLMKIKGYTNEGIKQWRYTDAGNRWANEIAPIPRRDRRHVQRGRQRGHGHDPATKFGHLRMMMDEAARDGMVEISCVECHGVLDWRDEDCPHCGMILDDRLHRLVGR